MSEAITAKAIWTNPSPEDEEPSLVRLTADELCLATIPGEDLEKTVANLEAGGHVASQNIPLGKVSGVEGYLESDSADATVAVTVTYKVSDSQTETAEFHLVDLGKQLKPIIEGFRNSQEQRTCKSCGAVYQA